MTSRLTLICHASTTAVRAAAFPADEPLDRHGLRRLESLSAGLRFAGRCFTSPALRAVQTAEILKLRAAAEPLLRDCDYGRWAGEAFEEVQAQEPEAALQWLSDPEAAPHGGESIAALRNRVGAWLDAQLEVSGKTVAVTHAAFIRAAVIHAIGAPLQSFWRIDVAPLSVTKLTGAGGRWTLASINPIMSFAAASIRHS